MNIRSSAFRILILYISLLFIPDILSAQTWLFANAFGTSASGTDKGTGVAVDAAGNVYVTGSYTGATNFGTGALATAVGADGFVSKFTSAGVCLWSIRFNSTNVAVDQGLAIATDGTSVYVGGSYAATGLTVNGTASNANLGGTDGVIFKLNATTGAVLWISTVNGAGGDLVHAICLDGAGDAYVSGSFTTSANFGSITRAARGGSASDAFVAKLNGATGAFVWVSTGGASAAADNLTGSGICYVPGTNSVVMTGGFVGSGAVYATTAPVSSVSLTGTAATGSDIAVVQVDASTGAFLSGLSVGGPSNGGEEGLGAVYDPQSSHVYLTGYFNSTTLSFSGNTVTGGGLDDAFYARYNPVTNTFIWARAAASIGQDRGLGISTDSRRTIYITGRFRGTFSIPTSTVPLTLVNTRTNGDEIFIIGVDNIDGYGRVAVKSTGNDLNTTSNQGIGIAAASNGNIWTTGTFASNLSFGGSFSLTPTGTNTADIFLSLLNAPVILPVDLTSFTGELVNGDVLLKWTTAIEVDHDYFEVERSSDGRNFTPVGRRYPQQSSSGNYSFTDAAASLPTGTLFYRLKIVSTIGTVEYSRVVTVYTDRSTPFVAGLRPNPFVNSLGVALNMPRDGKITFTIYDITGRQISRQQVEASKGFSTITIPGADRLARGTYTLSAEFEGERISQRLIKQ
ncbi:MAG: T9SS type A sorting domain-containing protein [Chitinophagaceae bacterium]